MGEDIVGVFVEVLVCAVAVGHVVVVVCTSRAIADVGDFPTSAYLAVIAGPPVVFVGEGKDNFTIGIVVAQGVHIGNGQLRGETTAVDADVDGQVASRASVGQQLASVGIRRGGQVGCNLLRRLPRMGVPGFNDRVWRCVGAALQYPVAHFAEVYGVIVVEEKVGGHVAVGVEDMAVEGEARQVFVLLDGLLVVIDRIG